MTSPNTTAMPGPWEVVWLKGDKLGSPSQVCVAGTENRVAFLASDGSLGTARLIAAAPSFAAAVEQMLAWESEGGVGWWKGWEMLKAAYEETKGE